MTKPYVPTQPEPQPPADEADDLLEEHRRDTIGGKRITSRRHRKAVEGSEQLLLPDPSGHEASDLPDFGVDDSGSW